MADDNPAQGGSYVMENGGTRRRVEFTADAATSTDETAAASPAPVPAPQPKTE